MDLASESAAIQRTVAYYMTLCDVGSRNFVQDMVYNIWAVNLDNDYRSAASHLLSPYGDLDNDGQFNIEEWQESGYDVEAYLARTLDDERAPDESLLDPEAETFVETCGYCTKTEVVFSAISTADGTFYGQGYKFDHCSAPGNLLNGERYHRRSYGGPWERGEQYVPMERRKEVERKIDNYRKFRELTKEWVDLGIQLCKIRTKREEDK